MGTISWKDHINDLGDFELPAYLYRMNQELMKNSLDFGTLLSEDPQKLRAYKEQVKKLFRKRWQELAQVLEFFDIVIPCTCSPGDYCEQCSGSRYRLSETLSPDQMQEVGLAVGMGARADLAEKLQKGLMKALEETDANKVR